MPNTPKWKLISFAILKAFLWLIIGIIFGCASIIMYKMSSIFFNTTQGESLTNYIIIFLSLSLMSGAGIDFLISSTSMSVSARFILFSCNFTTLVVAYFLFNPNNANKPDPETIYCMTWGYVITTFLYCVYCKSNLFYEESVIKNENSKIK